MGLSLVRYDDEILTSPAERFDFNNPPFDILQVSTELVMLMKDYNGLGLAAPQVGLPYQIFVMNCFPEPIIVINPRIVESSAEQVLMPERCLSYPGLVVKVKRPKAVKVRFTYPSGESNTHDFDSTEARVFQHEFDHLAGLVHINKANFLNKEKALKDWKIILRRQKAFEAEQNKLALKAAAKVN